MITTNSSVLTDTSTMPYGYFKDVPMIEVPAAYLLALLERSQCRGSVKQYIEDNKEALLLEIQTKPAHRKARDPFSHDRWD